MKYVENIPTKKEKKKENARISCSFKNAGGKERSKSQAGKRTEEALRLIKSRFFIVSKRVSSRSPLFVSVGKKISKKATERNLLKRRVRALFREYMKNKNLSLSVVVKPNARMVSFHELRRDVLEIFQKL